MALPHDHEGFLHLCATYALIILRQNRSLRDHGPARRKRSGTEKPTHSAGLAGLDVLEDRSVRVPGDEPGTVGSRSRPLNDLAARRFEGGKHRLGATPAGWRRPGRAPRA